MESALLPLFGKIVDIIVYNVDTCVFLLQEYVTECYSSHFHSYEVSIGPYYTYRACEQTDFVDYHPLCVYSLPSGTQYVPLKYHITENF